MLAPVAPYFLYIPRLEGPHRPGIPVPDKTEANSNYAIAENIYLEATANLC